MIPILLSLPFLVTLAIFMHYHDPSYKQQLQNLGYTEYEAKMLLEIDSQLGRNVLEDELLSSNIITFAKISGFSYDLYDEYTNLYQLNPDLTPHEIVSTVAFVHHVFKPTLYQAGYSTNFVETQILTSDMFLERFSSGDILSLNLFLNFAIYTDADVETLFLYVDYSMIVSGLEHSEIVERVMRKYNYIIPSLEERDFSKEKALSLYSEFGNSGLEKFLASNLSARTFLELMESNHFNIERLREYESILRYRDDVPASYAVQSVHRPYVKGHFGDENLRMAVINPHGLLALVNPNFRLHHEFRPAGLVTFRNNIQLRDVAAVALEELFVAGSWAGHEFVAIYGFLSYEDLQTRYLADEATRTFFIPGHSEYQTGLAAMVTAHNEIYADWLSENSHKFGFIVRYPLESDDNMSVMNSSQHLRYVGVRVATEIFERGWVFEDYILANEILDDEWDESEFELEESWELEAGNSNEQIPVEENHELDINYEEIFEEEGQHYFNPSEFMEEVRSPVPSLREISFF